MTFKYHALLEFLVFPIPVIGIDWGGIMENAGSCDLLYSIEKQQLLLLSVKAEAGR